MNIDQNNKIIIISSPSGAGKTTLCKLLMKKMKNISLSVSYTSRNQRLNETNGKDYYFIDKKKFNVLKKKNYFIETATNFGNYYGSPYSNLKEAKINNKNLLFDIDWKGARKIRKKIKKHKSFSMTFCLETKIIKPENDTKIKNAIILLHGYGGDGNDCCYIRKFEFTK